MKINKLFLLGLAGLAFTACSSDEEMTTQSGLPAGTGAVTINITSPELTRAIEAGTTDNLVKVTGDVTITLTATNGTKSISLKATDLTTQSSVTFWNVETPQSVSVSMNDGQASYAKVAPTAFTQAPSAIPAYGETSTFSLTDQTAKPGEKGGTAYETGAEAGDESKVYQLYTATVQLAIPVARLEVSGIQHVDGENGCAYKTLTIAGVYLDNVYATGEGVTYSNGSFSCVTGIAPTDYSYTGNDGTGIEAMFKDAATPTDFLTPDAVWPAAGNAYSYYFFGADGANNLPKFKIYFDTSEAKDGSHPLPAPRYAMITSYKNADGEIAKFEPGHIYRITSAKLTDENIIGDEGGNTLYGVEVTVEEAEWAVETIGAEWASK